MCRKGVAQAKNETQRKGIAVPHNRRQSRLEKKRAEKQEYVGLLLSDHYPEAHGVLWQ